ncbi:6-phosphogluconate dehydrogenase, decarboxylating [Delphinella strobiligena]|nr:6-phosphogluconate dehydrogenase, decarboxylating [Delphinella strobiligena]
MGQKDTIEKFKRIGIVGAGSMGTMMAYAFAEQGLDVSLWDVNPDNVDKAIQNSKEQNLKTTLQGFHDVDGFTKSLNGCPRKLLVFSITHGAPADTVLDKIKDHFKEGDIILDGGNEHYRTTERRQKMLEPKGVHWIGMGVSGGYQSARRGPSMCPGGDQKAIELVIPLLENFSAKDAKTGTPCVRYMGPAGAGHFIKMTHNGIENGMLSTMCEAWSLLHKSLGLSNDKIGKILEQWNSQGELRNTFLVQIGSEICQAKKTPKGDVNGEGKGDGGYVLDDVLDKVVQDIDNSEGTFFWTVMEAADRHVSAPTIAAGQFFRVASGDRDQRLRVAEKIKVPAPAKLNVEDKEAFVETLRRAVYCAFLASFCQGLEVIARASKDEGWNVDLAACIKIWRCGCIIQEEYIADMLEPILSNTSEPIMNLKLIDEVSAELHKNFQSLKETVMKGIEVDNYVPALSATLEYLKYVGGTSLATQFMEAEMDFFGAHNYDRPGVPGEDPGKAKKGAHHYEWRLA